jgi:hypothetical protein
VGGGLLGGDGKECEDCVNGGVCLEVTKGGCVDCGRGKEVRITRIFFFFLNLNNNSV